MSSSTCLASHVCVCVRAIGQSTMIVCDYRQDNFTALSEESIRNNFVIVPEDLIPKFASEGTERVDPEVEPPVRQPPRMRVACGIDPGAPVFAAATGEEAEEARLPRKLIDPRGRSAGGHGGGATRPHAVIHSGRRRRRQLQRSVTKRSTGPAFPSSPGSLNATSTPTAAGCSLLGGKVRSTSLPLKYQPFHEVTNNRDRERSIASSSLPYASSEHTSSPT